MRFVVTALVALLAWDGSAWADALPEAKAEYKQGTTDYALGDYASAAKHYERAFALSQDAGLLYNAAQAHRAAGNKTRALQLYENYLRVFGEKVENRDDVLRIITKLQESIQSEKNAQAAQQPRSGSTVDSLKTNESGGAKPSLKPNGSSANALAPVATTPSNDLTSKHSSKSKWIVVGTVVGVVAAAAIGVGLGVGLSGDRNPTPTFGAGVLR